MLRLILLTVLSTITLLANININNLVSNTSKKTDICKIYTDNINRYYNPTLGRYMQSDPIGFDGGVNTFGYVGGNPVVNIDEQGLFFDKVLGGVGAAVGGAIDLGDGAAVGWGIGYAAGKWIDRWTINKIASWAAEIANENSEDGDSPIILYHYTDYIHYQAIMASQKIMPGNKGLIYVSPCKKNSQEVENDLFIGLKPGFGNYVVAFMAKKGLFFEPGHHDCELIYRGGALRFGRHIKVIYSGKNKF